MRRQLIAIAIVGVTAIAAASASAGVLQVDDLQTDKMLSESGQVLKNVGGFQGVNVTVKATGDFVKGWPKPAGVGDHQTIIDNKASKHGTNSITLTFNVPVTVELTSTNDLAGDTERITLSADKGGTFTQQDGENGFAGTGRTIHTAPAAKTETLDALGANITSFTWTYSNDSDGAARQPLRVNILTHAALEQPGEVG